MSPNTCFQLGSDLKINERKHNNCAHPIPKIHIIYTYIIKFLALDLDLDSNPDLDLDPDPHQIRIQILNTENRHLLMDVYFLDIVKMTTSKLKHFKRFLDVYFTTK